MKRLSRMERRASEYDTANLPISDKIISWREFNTDFKSSERKYSEVASTVSRNLNERIDLRPYMIESPFVCTTTDKL